jgi:hypothetical protein
MRELPCTAPVLLGLLLACWSGSSIADPYARPVATEYRHPVWSNGLSRVVARSDDTRRQLDEQTRRLQDRVAAQRRVDEQRAREINERQRAEAQAQRHCQALDGRTRHFDAQARLSGPDHAATERLQHERRMAYDDRRRAGCSR